MGAIDGFDDDVWNAFAATRVQDGKDATSVAKNILNQGLSAVVQSNKDLRPEEKGRMGQVYARLQETTNARAQHEHTGTTGANAAFLRAAESYHAAVATVERAYTRLLLSGMPTARTEDTTPERLTLSMQDSNTVRQDVSNFLKQALPLMLPERTVSQAQMDGAVIEMLETLDTAAEMTRDNIRRTYHSQGSQKTTVAQR